MLASYTFHHINIDPAWQIFAVAMLQPIWNEHCDITRWVKTLNIHLYMHESIFFSTFCLIFRKIFPEISRKFFNTFWNLDLSTLNKNFTKIFQEFRTKIPRTLVKYSYGKVFTLGLNAAKNTYWSPPGMELGSIKDLPFAFQCNIFQKWQIFGASLLHSKERQRHAITEFFLGILILYDFLLKHFSIRLVLCSSIQSQSELPH